VLVAAVESLTDLDAATQQLISGALNVGDSQVQPLSGAWGCGSDALAEDD